MALGNNDAKRKCKKCGGELMKWESVKDGGSEATEWICEKCNVNEKGENCIVEEANGETYIISDRDVAKPLSDFVEPDETPRDIWEIKKYGMEKYGEIFYSLESTFVAMHEETPDMKDREVLHALRALIRDFDGQPDGSTPGELAKCVKAMLIRREKWGKRRLSKGEIISCLKWMEKIVLSHKNRRGNGYLRSAKVLIEKLL